jgi:transporter family-2 protein
LVIGLLVHGLFVGMPTQLPSDPWLYLGGAIGCIFIAGNALIVRTTGVLVLGLGIVAGQLLCALALDLFAPTHAGPIAVSTIAGTALALVAVLIVGARPRRARVA